jgi:NADPH:quinone reductase-like Zn-dependent oxidoreductase
VSNHDKAEHAKSAGADVVINYREEAVGSRVQQETGGSG